MVKITLRRAVLCGMALALSVLSLVALCFPVLRMDLASAAGSGSGLDELLGQAGGVATENGFAFLDGESRIVAFFRVLIAAIETVSGTTFHLSAPSSPEVLAQVFNILLLIVSVALIAASITWFCLSRREGAVRAIALIAGFAGVVYFAEGLICYLILEAQWAQVIDLAAGSASVFYGGMFSTQAYIPLILIAVFEIAFWVFTFSLRGRPAEEAARNAAEGAPAQLPAAPAEEDTFDRLRKLKALCDDGILTEQEFVAEKAKILSGGK